MLTGNSKSAAVWNVSGESTPSKELPEQFVPAARPSSLLHSSLRIAPDWNGNVRREPIVQRAQRTVGMKYLYVEGATKQPIKRVGADGVPYPFDSAFQPNIVGLIHNAGFNYALYQAGYPGYNLGISFKVQNINDESTGVPDTMRAGKQRRSSGPRSTKGGSRGTNAVGRSLGRRSS